MGLLFLLAALAFTPTPARAQDAPQFRLVGVIESRDFTGAVLVDSGNVQSFYRIGQELPDGSRIVKVERDSIGLRRRDGSSYELFIRHETKLAPPISIHPGVSAPPPARVLNQTRRGDRPDRRNAVERATREQKSRGGAGRHAGDRERWRQQ